MTPKEIQELMPEGYGGDFEMTMQTNHIVEANKLVVEK